MSEPIRLVCPECDTVHRVKSITLGKVYRCKKCKASLETLTPAILECPECGATHLPSYVEVSRIITCSECDNAPLMKVVFPEPRSSASAKLKAVAPPKEEHTPAESAVADTESVTENENERPVPAVPGIGKAAEEPREEGEIAEIVRNSIIDVIRDIRQPKINTEALEARIVVALSDQIDRTLAEITERLNRMESGQSPLASDLHVLIEKTVAKYVSALASNIADKDEQYKYELQHSVESAISNKLGEMNEHASDESPRIEELREDFLGELDKLSSRIAERDEQLGDLINSEVGQLLAMRLGELVRAVEDRQESRVVSLERGLRELLDHRLTEIVEREKPLDISPFETGLERIETRLSEQESRLREILYAESDSDEPDRFAGLENAIASRLSAVEDKINALPVFDGDALAQRIRESVEVQFAGMREQMPRAPELDSVVELVGNVVDEKIITLKNSIDTKSDFDGEELLDNIDLALSRHMRVLGESRQQKFSAESVDELKSQIESALASVAADRETFVEDIRDSLLENIRASLQERLDSVESLNNERIATVEERLLSSLQGFADHVEESFSSKIEQDNKELFAELSERLSGVLDERIPCGVGDERDIPTETRDAVAAHLVELENRLRADSLERDEVVRDSVKKELESALVKQAERLAEWSEEREHELATAVEKEVSRALSEIPEGATLEEAHVERIISDNLDRAMSEYSDKIISDNAGREERLQDKILAEFDSVISERMDAMRESMGRDIGEKADSLLLSIREFSGTDVTKSVYESVGALRKSIEESSSASEKSFVENISALRVDLFESIVHGEKNTLAAVEEKLSEFREQMSGSISAQVEKSISKSIESLPSTVEKKVVAPLKERLDKQIPQILSSIDSKAIAAKLVDETSGDSERRQKYLLGQMKAYKNTSLFVALPTFFVSLVVAGILIAQLLFRSDQTVTASSGLTTEQAESIGQVSDTLAAVRALRVDVAQMRNSQIGQDSLDKRLSLIEKIIKTDLVEKDNQLQISKNDIAALKKELAKMEVAREALTERIKRNDATIKKYTADLKKYSDTAIGWHERYQKLDKYLRSRRIDPDAILRSPTPPSGGEGQ